MSTVVLSAANAFNPGSNLWSIPDFSHSKWTEKIDWHLNFQITKFFRRQSLEISPILKDMIAKLEMELPTPRISEDQSLLIPSSRLLPNLWVLYQAHPSTPQEWISQIQRNWKALGKPSLRIFTPTNFNASILSEIWNKDCPKDDLIIVAD